MEMGTFIYGVFAIAIVLFVVLATSNTIGRYAVSNPPINASNLSQGYTYDHGLNTTTLGTTTTGMASDLVPLAWMFGVVLTGMLIVIYMARQAQKGKR